MWAWTPAYLTVVFAATGLDLSRSAGIGANLSALFHVMGIVAASAGGWLSDRWGRTAIIIAMMAASTMCSFTFGWLLTAPLGLLLLVGLVYGFSALGDSPVYSAGITEVVEPAQLGSVLAVRSLLGFGAGAVARAHRTRPEGRGGWRSASWESGGSWGFAPCSGFGLSRRVASLPADGDGVGLAMGSRPRAAISGPPDGEKPPRNSIEPCPVFPRRLPCRPRTANHPGSWGRSGPCPPRPAGASYPPSGR